MGLSQQEINEMSDFMSAFNDPVNNGVKASNKNPQLIDVTTLKNQQETDNIRAMNSILSNLGDIFNDPVVANNQSQIDDFKLLNQFDSIGDEGISEEEYLQMIANEKTTVPVNQYGGILNNTPKMVTYGETSKPIKWSVFSESVNDIKSVKRYYVSESSATNIIVDNIYVQELAECIKNHLNSGGTIDNLKIIGMIARSIEYKSTLDEAIRLMKERQLVLRECKYDVAQSFDKNIKTLKESAHSLRESIVNIVKSMNAK